MAPLPKFCPIATEIQAMLSQGRRDEALKLLVPRLEQGEASRQVQAIAADLLRPKDSDGKRGPKKKVPFKWLEIGFEYDRLRDDGMTDVAARLELEDLYPRQKRTIDAIIAFYKRALEEDSATRTEEFAHDVSPRR